MDPREGERGGRLGPSLAVAFFRNAVPPSEFHSEFLDCFVRTYSRAFKHMTYSRATFNKL